jgi:phage FluMu gp28-like protein
MLAAHKPYFLPYQARWLRDQSRLKFVEKARRVGWTYTQSYEDVKDAARADDPMDVWFSSADMSAAREYIRYCEIWTRVFEVAAESLGEIVIERDDDIKAFVIEFASGKRIHALSSNPAGFRSKGGKVVLDEFAKHKDQDALWKAALPSITWGFPIRVISTYNGRKNRYYRMVQEARRGNKWSLHSVNIIQAVEQGLADKILKRKLTPGERQAWLDELREIAGDEETWQQEYMCNPIDEATAWLPWDLITSCVHEAAGIPGLYQGGLCYVGMDIARRRNLTVIWVSELLDYLWTREVISLQNATFKEQDAHLEGVMNRYNVAKLCVDQTGMGERSVEEYKDKYGLYRTEGLLFSNSVKQDLALTGKEAFEDRQVWIPDGRAIKEAHHAVRKFTTSAGNPRFDADNDAEVGHADEFWAHMLAIHGVKDGMKRAKRALGSWSTDNW